MKGKGFSKHVKEDCLRVWVCESPKSWLVPSGGARVSHGLTPTLPNEGESPRFRATSSGLILPSSDPGHLALYPTASSCLLFGLNSSQHFQTRSGKSNFIEKKGSKWLALKQKYKQHLKSLNPKCPPWMRPVIRASKLGCQSRSQICSDKTLMCLLSLYDIPNILSRDAFLLLFVSLKWKWAHRLSGVTISWWLQNSALPHLSILPSISSCVSVTDQHRAQFVGSLVLNSPFTIPRLP